MKQRAQVEVQYFPKDKAITVRVCPRWPTYSVIKTHEHNDVFFSLISGCLVLLIGAAIFFTTDGAKKSNAK